MSEHTELQGEVIAFIRNGENAPAARALLERTWQAFADVANADLTTCGTRHLVAERALRVVEQFGWPASVDMLEWLSAEADQAGTRQNKAALERCIGVPF